MSIEVKVPVLPESVSDAIIATWHKKVGDSVRRDENLIDLETDKVVLEVPSPVDGVLKEIKFETGATVTSAQVIAVIEEGAVAAAPAQVTAPKAAEPGAAAESKVDTSALPPGAANYAARNDVNPADVTGTGRAGRVTKEDLVKHVTSGGGARPEQRVPMTRIRQRIAERMMQSKNSIAMLTSFNEVNLSKVMAMRKELGEPFEKTHGIKLGFMSFFVKAAVAALKKYPVLNASVDGNDIVYHGYFDIGIAVGSPRGLVVPILRNADQMSFADIEKKIAEYGQKARDGKLGIEELSGGTFSISNGGTFGSMLSTPIINPPQSAILGVHATKDRAVVENGQVVVRPINYLAMSYDHRIIDGREAVLGLVTMKEALEDPARLLFDI